MKNYSIVIIVISACFILSSCSNEKHYGTTARFEQELFLHEEIDKDILSSLQYSYPDFLNIFCKDVIGIGPLDSPNISEDINLFINDPVIREIKSKIDSVYSDFESYAKTIHSAIDRYEKIIGIEDSIDIITYLSGFNQSFLSLDGKLCIGLDNYLGAETIYYKNLAIPKYISQTMTPEFLPVDALRAWIISDIHDMEYSSTLLDNMIREGKILWLLKHAFPKIKENNIFRYTEDQLEWCNRHEKSMWEYILEQELLYSTDRILISRMTKEAPFVREFSQESPGRAGSWLGYKIISNYVKKSGADASALIKNIDSKSILAESRYRPG